MTYGPPAPLTDNDVREVVRRTIPIWALPRLRKSWDVARHTFLPDGYGRWSETFRVEVTPKGLKVWRVGAPPDHRGGFVPWKDVKRLIADVPDALVDRIDRTLWQRRAMEAAVEAESVRLGCRVSPPPDWRADYARLTDLLDNLWRDALLSDAEMALW